MQSPRGDNDETRDIHEVFDKFATSSAEGRLLPADKIVVALRFLGQYLTEEGLAELSKEFPAGGVKFDDFLVLLNTVQEMNANEADLMDAFAGLDTERTGTIALTQFKDLLMNVGKMSEEEATGVIAAAKEAEGSEGEDGAAADKVTYGFVVRAIGAFIA